MSVEVAPYNPVWVDWFKEIVEPIWMDLRDYIVDIVHVGSTSIVGLSAKPVIDIDIVVDDWTNFSLIVERLSAHGYTLIGDLGIKEREAFKHEKTPKYRHNLYVCLKDSTAYRNHVLLKKHLNENPSDFQRYIDLKLELAKTAINVDQYCRAKTDLILEFLEEEGMTPEELAEIRNQNLG